MCVCISVLSFGELSEILWMYGLICLIPFIVLGKVSAVISSNFSSALSFLSSASWIPVIHTLDRFVPQSLDALPTPHSSTYTFFLLFDS